MMLSTCNTGGQRQAGFTLVELAIVLVIVGLLIGGILKGQELIAATRVNSTVAQVKAIDASAYTFRDTFGGWPGDLPAANTRVPNCTGSCIVAAGAAGARGNSLVEGNFNAALPGGAGSNEAVAFFNQLYAANLISGLTAGANNAAPVIGADLLGATVLPTANFRISTAGTLAAQADVAGNAGATLFGANTQLLMLSALQAGQALTTANIEANNGIEAKSANSIDTKMDDGIAGTGDVRGVNSTAPTNAAGCFAAGAPITYNGQNPNPDCGVAIRILQ